MTNLSEQSEKTVSRLKNYYNNLISRGYTDQNAHEKVVFDNGDIDYNLTCFATGRHLDPEQLQHISRI